MRLIEFNTKTSFPPTVEITKDQVLELLRTRGEKFFKLFNYKLGYNLLRVNSPLNTVNFISRSPDDRKPKDTYIKFHDTLDKKLEEAGFKARRSNSIFCRGSSLTMCNKIARRIFPLDDFDYTWCHSGDLMLDYNLGINAWRRGEEIEAGSRKFEDPDTGAQMYLDLKNLTPDEFIELYGFHNTRLQSAIMQRNEIYIHGNYIAVGDDNISNEIDRIYGKKR